jgi:hypothetical protein
VTAAEVRTGAGEVPAGVCVPRAAAFTLPAARHGSLVTAGARTRSERHQWNIEAAGTA